MKKRMLRALALVCCLMAAGLISDTLFDTRFVVTQEAEARVGRPLTPLSVAGVARRTTRRVIRRTAVYAPVLPRGCTAISIDGVTVQRCGTTYYQPYGSQWVVVTIS